MIGAESDRSFVRRAYAKSPLRFVISRGVAAPREAAWVFTTGFGGGLVDGDRIRLDVDVEPGARALVTTPASGKVYRGSSSSALVASVGRGALLASLPDPIAPFAGASLDQRTVIELDDDASLVLLDGLTAGRLPRNERWSAAKIRSSVEVRRGGRAVLRDALLLDAAAGRPTEARMARFVALSTLVLAGPLTARLRSAAIEAHAAPVARGAEVVVAVSARDDLALVRIAATSAERASEVTRRLLAGLDRALGCDPWTRRA